MMNDQEMQFADPEWRPQQNASQAAVGPDPYIPQPINVERAEQPRWQEPAPERVYTAQEPPPYQSFQPPPPPPQMPVGGQYGQVRPRRRRRIWPWIIAACILLAVIGGNIGRTFDGMGHSMDKGISAQPVPFDQTRKFTVNQQPTIIINGSFGTIHIVSGNAAHEVSIHTDGPGANITETGSDTIQVTDGGNLISSNVSVDVTVPANANLVVQTVDGNVNVEGVSGQMTLTSLNGPIDLHNVALSGNSIIKTDNGDITFDGSLDPNGNYQFINTTGSINLTLPSNSGFHLNATTNNGSINSSFPSVQPSSRGSGAQAQGSVGNGPQATVTISSVSGDISINGR